MSERSSSKLIASACIGSFLLSLLLPAFQFSASRFNQNGFEVFAKGWLGIVVLDPRWYANVAFLYCLLGNLKGFGRRRAPLFGAVLVFATYLLPVYYYPQDHGIRVDNFGPAVHLWALALLPTFAVSFFTDVPKAEPQVKRPPARP